ncbi:MAG: serine hydrolase [Leptolyngbyaceae cyanobacterium SM2_3_12]|nr:serine hydrolase [Leptolyngbyaceae cyanobacterium SM2_3_12]
MEGSSRPRSRPGPPRRRLAKPPLPLLYLIRMVILGVGVAAIAGTLLSVLNPSNLASSSGQDGAVSGDPLAPKATGALVQGGAAATVTDIRLTSELTRLKAQLEQLVTLTPRLTPTLFLLDLDGGRYVDMGGSDSVAAASTIKVPILVAFLQQVDAGTIALNQGLTLQESQVAGGSGDMRNDSVGTQYTALEVATRMIVTSDNTATNMMIAALGGPEALNQTFAAWGMESTVIRNPLPDIEGTNTTSARDLALLMALVDQGGLLAPRSRDRMFSIMQRTVNRALIPSGLGQADIVANKTGDIGMMLGDVALIDASNGERYVLAVLVQRPDNDGRANELIRRMTEAAHGELNQPIAPVGGVEPAATETVPETLPETGDTPGSMGEPPASITPEVSPQPAADEIPPG